MAEKRCFQARWANFFADDPVEGPRWANFFAKTPLEGLRWAKFFAVEPVKAPRWANFFAEKPTAALKMYYVQTRELIVASGKATVASGKIG